MPPKVDSVTDSVRICQTMSRRRAPSALRSPLADHHQHDVHDDDAADHQRQRDNADQNGEDAAGRGLVDAEEGVGGEQAEVVGILGAQPAVDAERHRGVVDRRIEEFGRARLDHELQAEIARPEHLLEDAERNDREVVL
jgi:hypothetical protein